MAELLTAISYTTNNTPWSEGKNLYTNLFDNNMSTFADYNGTDAALTMTYSGYVCISKIEYSARNDDWASRIVGGIIQGSNDGIYWITLHTISSYTLNAITSIEINSQGAYKYIRFSCPYLNCSILNLYGEEKNEMAFDGWYADENGNIDNSKFPSMPEAAMSEPYPDALWRIDGVNNDGLPFHYLMPDMIRLSNQPLIWMGSTQIASVYYGKKPIVAIYYRSKQIL